MGETGVIGVEAGGVTEPASNLVLVWMERRAFSPHVAVGIILRISSWCPHRHVRVDVYCVDG
jgi:hypothetical protein